MVEEGEVMGISYQDLMDTLRLMEECKETEATLIIDKWSVRRPWFQRIFGFAVRRWQFNKTFIRTADGKVHQTGPI